MNMIHLDVYRRERQERLQREQRERDRPVISVAWAFILGALVAFWWSVISWAIS